MMLIDGRWRPSDGSLLIASVFILDEELVGGVDISNPLAVLERFSQEFGYTISVGDQQSKFIHDRRITIIDSSNLNPAHFICKYIKITDNGMDVTDYLGDIKMRSVNLGGSFYTEIASAYCIRVDKYSM